MKKYECVKIKLGVFGSFSSKETGKMSTCEAIDQYARRGFRYAGYIPEEIGAYGNIAAINLIFEKDE